MNKGTYCRNGIDGNFKQVAMSKNSKCNKLSTKFLKKKSQWCMGSKTFTSLTYNMSKKRNESLFIS